MFRSLFIYLFISLSKLLILKTIKIFEKYYQSNVVIWQHMFNVPVMRTVRRREQSPVAAPVGVNKI